MKFSVITVAYNCASTIAQTLQSVAEQTHGEVEHIVVDGASKDGTLDVVRHFGQRVAVCISEPDRGIYDAMNKGLARASGDVVGFLNADDSYASAETLARMAAAFGQSDFIFGDLNYVSNSVVGETPRIVRRWRSGAFSQQRLAFGWMPPHPTFYASRAFLAGQQFNLQYRIAADYDFMLRCLMRPDVKAAYMPEVLVHMRTGGASNRSLRAMFQKSSEDYQALRANRAGGALTLMAKNLRKLPQFLSR